MELNKNSKWIKFYLNFNSDYPNNFCDYFWGSLKGIVATIVIILVFSLLLTSLFSPIALFWSELDTKSILGTFQIVGCMLWVLIIIMFIIRKILNYCDNRPYKYKPKKNSLIKQWYLDFKNKHCTMITWK